METEQKSSQTYEIAQKDTEIRQKSKTCLGKKKTTSSNLEQKKRKCKAHDTDYGKKVEKNYKGYRHCIQMDLETIRISNIIQKKGVHPMEKEVKGFIISDDKGKLQLNMVAQLLHTTAWAEHRMEDVIARSIENSICFGIYKEGIQVGFARCVTDYATMYWLADVVIAPEYRGIGLGKALVNTVVNYEPLQGCGAILRTRDAHGLYAQYGFTSDQERYMQRVTH